VKLSISQHAVDRYQERVRPTLDTEAARTELEAVLSMDPERINEAPEWVHVCETKADYYLEVADGIVAPVAQGHVLTIITRGGSHPEHRARKMETKRRRRAARKRKPLIYSGQKRKYVEPRKAWK
jgi:endonuclease III